MTTTTTSATAAPADDNVARAARVPVTRAYRFELVKLVSQWRVRLMVLACWIAPGLFVVAVSRQSTLPSDTLFGEERLKTVLQSHYGADPTEILNQVDEALYRHTAPGRPADDINIIVLQHPPGVG